MNAIDKRDQVYLQKTIGDLINYSAADPLEPIDPLTYLTPEGDSCLHLAALRGDYHAVEILLDAGAQVNARGDMGNTPLHLAAKGGHREVFALLLKHGADTGLVNEFGSTPTDDMD